MSLLNVDSLKAVSGDTLLIQSNVVLAPGKTFYGIGTGTSGVDTSSLASVAMVANAIDLSLGSVFTKPITAATTLTVSNIPASGIVASFILELTNGGAFTTTWWKGKTNEDIKWAGGTAPTLTASGVDILGFYTHDGGVTWRGLVLAKDSK